MAGVLAFALLIGVFVWEWIQWRIAHTPQPLATKSLPAPVAKLLYEPLEASVDTPTKLPEVFWDPIKRQEVEPDTLFLFDAAQEKAKGTVDGAFMAGNPDKADDPWRDIVLKPGKYRTGIRCMQPKLGFIWLPSDGLFSPDEFTVEFWLQSDKPWNQLEKEMPLQIGGDDTGSCNLRFFIGRGKLQLTFDHWQSPAGRSLTVLEHDLREHPIEPTVWTNVAATFKDGTLKLFLNGEEVGSEVNIPVPRVWSSNAKRNGLCLGGAPGAGTESSSISDLRISRRARVPQSKIWADARNVLTVDPEVKTETRIQTALLGGLHTLKGPATEKRAKGTLKVIRTDKLLTVTPIKLGEPDPAHPVQGISRKFSYDWQVVDRTFDYLKSLDVTAYVSLDGTPSILGGEVKPFSGEKLSSARSFQSAFGSAVPANFDDLGLVVRDLVHHVLKEKGYKVGWWGVWNEPNSEEFWKGDLKSYLRLYEVCAGAVREVEPTAKVGGPEIARYLPEWLEALVRHCGQQNIPLDFVSWHYYSGSTAQLSRFSTQIGSWSAQYGLKKMPELVIGEWCWQISNMPKGGLRPFRDRNYFINDWHAAFAAQSLIEMQRCGIAASIYTNPVAEKGAKGWNASGLMSEAGPWANWNVYRLWDKMAPDVVASQWRGLPGTSAVASGDGKRLTVLIANRHFRKDKDTEMDLRIPGLKNGSAARIWTIDDRQANAFDAGPARGELTSTTVTIQQDKLPLKLRPRSVSLVEVTL